MSSGIRTTNLPLAALFEVIGHADAGGGARTLARSSIGAVADAVRDIVTEDPSGVAGVRRDLAALSNVVAMELTPALTDIVNIQDLLKVYGDTLAAYDTFRALSRIVDLETLTGVFGTTLDFDGKAIEAVTNRVAAAEQSLTDARKALEAFSSYADKALNLLEDRADFFDANNASNASVAKVADALGFLTGRYDVSTKAIVERLDALAREHELLADTVEGRRFEWLAAGYRPGERPAGFVVVKRLADLSTGRLKLPDLASDLVAVADQGQVVRLEGSGILATRRAFAIERGRVGRARAAVQRRSTPADPAGDAVRIVLIWLGQSGTILPGADASTLVKQFNRLETGIGRQAVEVLFSLDPDPGLMMTQAPKAARAALLAVQTFGPDGVTDIEVLGIDDVTSATVLDPVSSDVEARVGAIESGDVVPRLEAVEARVQAPNSVTYASIADAKAGSIPATVSTVEVRGAKTAGDGAGGLYRKIAGDLGPGEDGFVAGGATFRRVTLAQAAFNADYGALLAGFYAGLPTAPPDEGGLWLNNGVPEMAKRAGA